MQFGQLIGQDHALTILRRAVRSGHVPHAYLFEGPPGVGKRAAALGLAQALNCAASPGEGCGACETCRRIEGILHPDVPVFAPDGAQLLVEQADAILALAQSPPHEAPTRVIVIDDADRMTIAAANRLLKTLEEPRHGTHIVLVTSAPDRIISTIRSRVQRVRFRALPAASLVALLAARGVERARAELAAALADGSVAGAIELASQEADEPLWQKVTALRDAARSAAASDIFDAASSVAGEREDKQELPRVLAALARLYRDAAVEAAGAGELAVLADRAAPLASDGVAALGRALAAIVEANDALAANVNPTLALERMMLRMRREAGSAARART